MFFSIYTYPQEILKYSIQKSTSPTQESASLPREATSQYLAVITSQSPTCPVPYSKFTSLHSTTPVCKEQKKPCATEVLKGLCYQH